MKIQTRYKQKSKIRNICTIPYAEWFEETQASHFREHGEFVRRTPHKPLHFVYMFNFPSDRETHHSQLMIEIGVSFINGP